MSVSSYEQRNFNQTIDIQVDLDDVIDFLQSNMSVEDVFGYQELADWALGNGFVEDEG